MATSWASIKRTIVLAVCCSLSAGSALSCLAGADIATIGRASDGEKVERLRHQLHSLARELADDAWALVRAALESPRGAGYGMIQSEDPLYDSPEHSELKRLEASVRRLFDSYLPMGSGVRLGYLAYGDFIFFVERPFASEEERQSWRSTSGGDMYRGRFGALEFGDPIDAASEDFGRLKGGWYLGVPVVRNGLYVGAVYLVLEDGAESRASAEGGLPPAAP